VQLLLEIGHRQNVQIFHRCGIAIPEEVRNSRQHVAGFEYSDNPDNSKWNRYQSSFNISHDPHVLSIL
jgi:hypothetical protein